MDKTLWSVSLFLILTGILLLIGGVGVQFYLSWKEPLKGRTSAKVVELLLQESNQHISEYGYKNLYYPVLEYYAEGKLYKIIHEEGAYPSPFRVNQELALKYEKTDPVNYQIIEKRPKNKTAELLYGTGVACIALGCIFFVTFALRVMA